MFLRNGNGRESQNLFSLPVPVPLVDACLGGVEAFAQLSVGGGRPVGVGLELILKDGCLVVWHFEASLLLLSDLGVAARVKNVVDHGLQILLLRQAFRDYLLLILQFINLLSLLVVWAFTVIAAVDFFEVNFDAALVQLHISVIHIGVLGWDEVLNVGVLVENFLSVAVGNDIGGAVVDKELMHLWLHRISIWLAVKLASVLIEGGSLVGLGLDEELVEADAHSVCFVEEFLLGLLLVLSLGRLKVVPEWPLLGLAVIEQSNWMISLVFFAAWGSPLHWW